MYKIYFLQNNKIVLSRETNNREIALRVYKNYIANSQYIQKDNIIIVLYYNKKRLKTYKKPLTK